MHPLFRLQHLSKHYPLYSGILRRKIGVVKALDDISFDLFEGEVLAIVGESGSGKSTLAQILLHLIFPTSGVVFFEKKNLFQFSSKELLTFRKKVQMVFQNPFQSLNPRKTIFQTFVEILALHTSQDKVIFEKRIEEALELVGLSKQFVSYYPHQFSGGQQQRISLARALLCRPQLLVLDEALSALDLSIQAQMLNLLYDLKQKFSLTYLFISHDLMSVKAFCDRVIVLDKGKLVEQALTETIFSNPKHLSSIKLFSNFS